MPIPTLITDLAITAALNSPAGGESVTTADDYLRAQASFIAQLRDRLQPVALGGTGATTANAGADALGAFRRGTLLGTVSQTAGVPTGAVIETGANANGAYTRFADGTQICTFATGSVPASTSLYMPGLYQSGFTWTYPAAFISPAFLSGGGVDQSASGWISQQNTGTATAGNYVYYSTTSSITGAVRTLTAIGRWF